MIVGISNNSSYYLKDHFSHFLHHSVPASQLVKFFENKTYQCDKKTNTIQGDDSESNLSVHMNLSDDDDYIPGNSDSPSNHQKCQGMQSFQSQESMTTSTLKLKLKLTTFDIAHHIKD